MEGKSIVSTCVVYDIKGIQQVITSVPRLRYMVGASSLIAQFDLHIAPELAKRHGAKVDAGSDPDATSGSGLACTCGGGKGTIVVPDEQRANELRLHLVQKAHRLGLDIRIGVGRDAEEAWSQQDLLPFVPLIFTGVPCGQSGMYPVRKPKELKDPSAHRVVRNRFIASSANPGYRAQVLEADPGPENHDHDQETIFADGEIQGDLVGTLVLKQMAEDLAALRPAKGKVRALASKQMQTDGKTAFTIHCRFMRNVSSDSADQEAEKADGYLGQAALNHRNRWAVLVFDGNDIGRQITAAQDAAKPVGGRSSPAFRDFMGRMSAGLNRLTLQTVAAGLSAAVKEWVQARNEAQDDWDNVTADGDDGQPVIVLPFRPLVAGGDDIQVLAHPDHAFTLASAMCNHWHDHSSSITGSDGKPLWNSTGGTLTTSGGIVFINNSYPIASAIDYAHRLLDHAKASQRGQAPEGQPSPAAVDFEIVTDSLLDHPQRRRNRELVFTDPDLGNRPIRLTRRPYRIGNELDKVLELARRLGDAEARHALAEVQAALRLPYHQRLAAAWRMAKRHPLLAVLLAGPAIPGQPPPPPEGMLDRTDRALAAQAWLIPPDPHQPITTILWDAILVVEETIRLQQETARA